MEVGSHALELMPNQCQMGISIKSQN